MGRFSWAACVVITLTAAIKSVESSVPVNVTVDDADSRVVYAGLWNTQTCTSCPDTPPEGDLNMINNGTWHDGTQAATDTAVLSASLTFTGTGVYVFGILPPFEPASTRTSLNFAIDGVSNGTYLSAPTTTVTGYQYKINFFSAQGLTNQSHTVTMMCNRPSFVMLDFFVYTYLTPPDDPTPSQSETSTHPHSSGRPHGPPGYPPPHSPPPNQTDGNNKTDLSAAVGGAVGGVLGVIILAGLAFWCFHRRKQEHAQAPPPPHFADMPAYASSTNQVITPWIDLTPYTATPSTGFMPSNSQQCLENQPLVPLRQTTSFSPSATSPAHPSQRTEYNPAAHSRPPGTSDSNSSGAPPSSLQVSSPGGLLPPRSLSAGTHGHSPPPQYDNPGP